MKCPDCGATMKPLATSMYCPNDCDRIVTEHIDPEKTPKVIFWEYQDKDGKISASGSLSAQDLPEQDLSWIDSLFDGIMDGTD